MNVKRLNLFVLSLVILCVQLIACSSQPDYVGKWEKEDGVTLELSKDGKIIYDCPPLEFFDIESPVLGTYEAYGEEIIKVSFEGTFGTSLKLSDTDTWTITVSGNSMTVDWGDDELIQEYTKVKSGKKEVVEELPKDKPQVELTYTGPEVYLITPDNYVIAQGIVYNVGAVDACSVKVVVTFYDVENSIIDEGTAYIDRLSAGDSWKYEVSYSGLALEWSKFNGATCEVFGYAEEQ